MEARYRLPAAFILLCLFTAVASAQFQEPSHPLSQINPVDVPLNMSNKPVLNVSVLSLSNPSGDGFNIDNYAITDTTGTNRLELDPSENQFQVKGSELNLSGNNLTTPNNLKTGGQTITLRDSTNQQDLLRAKEGGIIEVPNSNQLIFDDPNGRRGQIYQDGGNLVIRNAANKVGVDIVSKGQGTLIRGEGNSDTALIIEEDSGGRIAQFLGGNPGEVRFIDSNLNVTGNNITNIDTLKFEEGTSLDGNLTINGSTDITGELNLSGDVDLNNNDLLEPDELRTSGSGSDEISIRDTSNGQDILQAREGGDVQVPNGDIIVGTTGDSSSFRFESGVRFDTPSLGTARISATGGGTNNLFLLRDERDDLRVFEVGEQGPIDLRNPETGEDILRLNHSGGSDVEIPNGELNVSDRILTNRGSVTSPGYSFYADQNTGIYSSQDDVLSVVTNGNEAFRVLGPQTTSFSGNNIRDITSVSGTPGSPLLLRANQNANDGTEQDLVLQTLDSGTNSYVDALRASANSGSPVINIPNGDLNLNENEIQNVDGIQDGSGANTITFNGNNNVQISNGNLDLNANNITSIDTLKFVEGTSIDGDLTVNGSINATGDIDLKDNNLLDANNVQTNRLVDPEDGQIEVDDNINLQNNQNIRSGGTNAITLDNNQNIGIPNGNLRLNGNNLVSNVEDNMRVETQRSLVLNGDADSDGTGQIALQTGDNTRVFVTNTGRVEVQDNDLDLQGNRIVDDTSSNTVYIGDGTDDNVRLETGGKDVDVPSGDLDVAGENVKNVNRVDFSNDEEIEEKNGDLCLGDRCA